MDFLKRNVIKLILVGLVVFLVLPFIYSNEEEGEFSPFAIKSGLSYHSNPISKLANRIASFYGFSSSNLQTAGGKPNINDGSKISGRKNLNKNQAPKNAANFVNQGQERGIDSLNDSHSVAANYNSGYEKYFDTNSKQNAVLEEENNTNINITNNINTAKAPRTAAKSKTRHNFDKGDTTIYGPNWGSDLANSATRVNYDDYTYHRPAARVEEYVQIDNDKFKVIQDITGKKYVATAKGHIPYDVILRNTVSEKEFFAAKKHLVTATDSEIINYVLNQKRAAFAAEQDNNSVASTNHMGVAKKTVYSSARDVNNSIKTDVGLTDRMIYEVYDGLKDYKFNSSNGIGKGEDAIVAGVNLSNVNRDIGQRVQDTHTENLAQKTNEEDVEELKEYEEFVKEEDELDEDKERFGFWKKVKRWFKENGERVERYKLENQQEKEEKRAERKEKRGKQKADVKERRFRKKANMEKMELIDDLSTITYQGMEMGDDGHVVHKEQ